MKLKLKHLIVFIVLLSFSSIIYGFVIQEKETLASTKFIGFGTVGLFFIAMPLFLIKESKGKNMKDYMLTHENIKKMQGKDRENAENQ
ncbi:MAG: hypothetical protein ABJN84_08200 [Flavobacteriaceae bacterium]